MILGPIKLIDCFFFIAFFAINIVFYPSQWWLVLRYAITALPFLVFKLPANLLRERVLLDDASNSPFVQQASFFEDLVIRCVRYAFATLPAGVGRIFFSKGVAYPFYRWRLLRSGYLRFPFHLKEVRTSPSKDVTLNGVWVVLDPNVKPDVVIYYCHGGGFAMGSSYFYLEFLVAWMSRLKQAGFQNPGVFALEYTLVPDATWPTQVDETTAGWNFLCEHITDASRICICGDSAGATLVLSHLLRDDSSPTSDYQNLTPETNQAAIAILISPWTDLISSLNMNTESDYLCKETLEIYAKQYAGDRENSDISPSGNSQQWRAASPLQGFAFVYGAEEVFRPAIEAAADRIRDAGCQVSLTRLKGGIHAWPVVDLFLADSQKRLRGLDKLTDIVWNCIHPGLKR